jgi:hypothetical protein
VPGYVIAGEVLPGPTNAPFVVPPLPDGLKRYTLVTWMIHAHGDEFIEWIAEAVRDGTIAALMKGDG